MWYYAPDCLKVGEAEVGEAEVSVFVEWEFHNGVDGFAFNWWGRICTVRVCEVVVDAWDGGGFDEVGVFVNNGC